MTKRRRATVRLRVTALATLAVVGVLTVTGTVLVLRQRQVLTDSLDESLSLEADRVARTATRPPATLDGVIDDEGVAQIVRGKKVIAATANLRGREPLAPAPASGAAVHNVDGVLADAPEFRVLARRVNADLVVYVGAPRDEIVEAVADLTRSLAIGIPVVIAALGGLVWMLVGRTLAPVEAIRAEVATIGAGALNRRVPEPQIDDEIGRLARTMNAMLERVEVASRREQRFVADASHELRSPLTRIRSELEVDLARPQRADPFATHRSVLAEAGELERLVDDLLVLAQFDSGAVVEGVPVDLDDVVLRHVAEARPIGATFDVSGVSGAQVPGNRRDLSRAVGNVVDNAVRHAATTVTIALTEDAAGQSAVLTVANDGAAIAPADQERIFERFARLDDARARDAGGTGLGLAIAREIVERHRGSIIVDKQFTGGARFVVRLPL